MLSSIHPLGERGRRNRFGITAAAFVTGSVLGGGSTGALLGLVGVLAPLGDSGRLVLLAVAAVVALGFDLTGRSLPSLRRQVDESWLQSYRGWVYGLGFGFQLGAGVLTYITAAAVVLWLGAMVAADSLGVAMLIGAGFGSVRGLSILASRQVTDPDRLRHLFQRLHATAPTVRRVGIGALAILTVITLTLATASVTDPPTVEESHHG